ncbi:hypothetical protein ACHAWU_004002 [Discostella pseudostelligera]|uniref:Glycosyl transferase 64 domain-containing protein n=1 Tax=Discostella pseudostelligera TaxID=259834 RepID=A0ABD3MUQ3_9STRA
MILTVSMGLYQVNQHSLSLQSRLQGFEGQWTKENANSTQQQLQLRHNESVDLSNDERTVFESIVKRVRWTEIQCNSTPREERNSVTKAFQPATDLPMLPEGGVATALEQWLDENASPITAHQSEEYPTCYLPPTTSCHVTKYTLVIMSHTTERLEVFMDPLASMVDSWPGLTEVIIVWNSPRETLTNAVNNSNESKDKRYATMLLQWHEDNSHPLRIFFSLENGLTNNLLNRYHPKLEPKNEAVMYFDDDGPFWSKETMVYAGFELWKRNSNVQVGGFPRNVRFLSDRMKRLEKVNLQRSIDIITTDASGGNDNEAYPTFTPICRNVTGDHVEYNYFTFPDFAGHVLLPSGTFLHRNYLCFIWHPAFEELRQWVVAHKTMPDDMTVSTLISHLSGRAPRTFPKEVEVRSSSKSRMPPPNDFVRVEETDSPPADQSHRRLLWKQKGWGIMREEAINSILGYFGSVHPGTVGWCAGTPYMKSNNRGVPFVCHPEKPTLDLIPWLVEGGIGSTKCPLIPQSVLTATEEDVIRGEDDSFCGECKYKNAFSCQARMKYLIDNYNNSPAEAKAAVISEDANCMGINTYT